MLLKTKIGVFDSGVGGQAVLAAIQRELPELDIVYKSDMTHVPYGTKTVDQIYGYTKPIFEEFVNEGCRVIVVACNTVTTTLITRLREEFKVPVVGIEPMVKPAAAATKTKIIAVCATPRTLSSERYIWLKAKYAKGIKVLEPDCSDWAAMIEANRVERDKVANTINHIIEIGADQIVLGCTHYHWIEQIIKDIANGRAQVLQPESAIVSRLNTVLAQLA